MSKSLFQISKEYLDIITLLEEDELTPELEQGLEIAQAELSEKAGNYLKAISMLEAEAAMAKDHEAKAKAYRARKEKAVARLKEALKSAIQTFGPQEVGITTLKIRKSEAVQVDDVESLPEQFVKVKVSKQPDKTAIKKAIKAGEVVEGATIVENQNLQIK